jgi:membrane protease YdiL (CAAX protease family)
MWKRGTQYLQIGWDPDSDRPSVFAVMGNIVGSLAFFYGAALVVSLLMRLVPFDMDRSFAGSKSFYASIISFASTALAFLPVLLHLRRSLNCSIADVFFGKNRNPFWFFAGIAITWTILVLGQISVGGKIRWSSPTPEQTILLVPLLLAILFQSTAEELAFRGYFSKAVYLLGRGLIPVFVIVPLAFFLYHQQFNYAAFLFYGGLGVFYSYLSLRTGGLQLSAGAHFANNSFVVLAGNWIVQTQQSNLLLLDGVEMIVVALLLEFALRLSKSAHADDVSFIAGNGNRPR